MQSLAGKMPGQGIPKSAALPYHIGNFCISRRISFGTSRLYQTGISVWEKGERLLWFAGILFVGKKEDLWQITLYKSRYDSYKTGEFRLQCGLWGYFHEGEPLMISLENLIFKKFEVSGKLDFRL